VLHGLHVVMVLCEVWVGWGGGCDTPSALLTGVAASGGVSLQRSVSFLAPTKLQGPAIGALFTLLNALQSHPAVVLYVLLYAKSTIPNAQHDLEGGVL
jgi:hypothetical protein